MQVNAPFRPPGRSQDLSPASTGSEWSGMNGYNQPPPQRPDGFRAPSRGDSRTPPDTFNHQPPYRSQTFGGSPTDPNTSNKRPSENGSRASSRAGSRSSDGNLENPRSRNYQRMESELRQHYAVLRAYLRGGAAQPPRPNKARDKLLRLSPVQFHELSTDVFDELQRRQAAAPLPGRPPRQDKVPPFLQPRPDFHEKRNQARQKLSSLQTSRFRDLSTDVFCELERRFPHFSPDNKRESSRSQRGGPGRPLPPGPNGFGPPGRAHTANSSMSSNAGFPPRKGSIAQSDFAHPNERPMQKQFQSNTITPNKSTMIEDDDDDEGGPISRYERSSDAFGLESALTSPRSRRDTSATSFTGGSRDIRSQPPPYEMQEKIQDLENKMQAKDEELSTATTRNHQLEQKLEDAERLHKEAQDELDRVQSDKANMERDLRSQISSAQSSTDAGPWREQHEQLERDHRELQERYSKQLQTTDEVSKQFKAHLAEIREFTQANEAQSEREQQLHEDKQKLEEELKEWKSRYIKAKTALRTMRASYINPQALRAPDTHLLGNDAFHSENGMVKDVHVTKFQLAIDELLSVARSEAPHSVLEHMKSIVTAVRGITGDIESVTARDKGDDAISKRRNKFKAKVSATANNLITAARNYAAAQGLSPVSLLDAAASHLTAAVVDLLKVVQIRPSPQGELQDDAEDSSHLTPVNDAGYFNINISQDLRRRSGADSVYSAVSDPPEGTQRTPTTNGPNGTNHVNGLGASNGLGISTTYGLSQDEQDLEDLKVYVGNQTDSLVQYIQALVTSIRNEELMPMIRSRMTDIADVADNILGATEGSMEEPSAFQSLLAQQVSTVAQQLSQSKLRLEEATINSQKHDGQPSAKEFSQTFPPLAFQLAREAKDLVSRIEAVRIGENHSTAVETEEDDFS